MPLLSSVSLAEVAGETARARGTRPIAVTMRVFTTAAAEAGAPAAGRGTTSGTRPVRAGPRRDGQQVVAVSQLREKERSSAGERPLNGYSEPEISCSKDLLSMSGSALVTSSERRNAFEKGRRDALQAQCEPKPSSFYQGRTCPHAGLVAECRACCLRHYGSRASGRNARMGWHELSAPLAPSCSRATLLDLPSDLFVLRPF